MTEPYNRMERKAMNTNRITEGAERAIIENMLDRNREALIETARGLSDADARRQPPRNGSGSNDSGRDSTKAGHGDILREQIVSAR
ncbi:DinB family protein [Mycobacterium sp. 141]|uniref:DinB family protein n=1 Tax=Mycobacterium sp. 141 TaxID=1120797 RepID=UPI001E54DCE1|nr:DinB family protein [Mycobacterium sp. 141]